MQIFLTTLISPNQLLISYFYTTTYSVYTTGSNTILKLNLAIYIFREGIILNIVKQKINTVQKIVNNDLYPPSESRTHYK